jgi:hypothetical protein
LIDIKLSQPYFGHVFGRTSCGPFTGNFALKALAFLIKFFGILELVHVSIHAQAPILSSQQFRIY